MIKIAPSVLAADYANMGSAVSILHEAGADWIHFDVMDGHFVPNISFGPSMLKALRPYSTLPMDVHLMVSRPADWIDPFLDAGADIITFHVEAETHIQRQLQRIRDAKRKAGLVLNPGTPLCMVEPCLAYCDVVLIMSVNPGFGGQRFLEPSLEKISALRDMARRRGLQPDIEVDGGITPESALKCVQAGATVLVAGNTVFSAPDPGEMIAKLREAT